MAFFFIPLTTVTLAGLSNFVRITAGAMGTTIATTLWDSRAAMHHAHLTEPLTAQTPAAADIFLVSGFFFLALIGRFG